MERVLSAIEDGKEGKISKALAEFNDKNKSNFQLGEATETRRNFIRAILDHLDGSSLDQPWPLKIQSLSLASLRIASREREGTQLLTSSKGLGILSRCARLFLDSSASLGGPPSNEEVEVVIEAVKCLCNLVLNNHDLATDCSEIGCLRGLSSHLAQLGQFKNLPFFNNLTFFELRLLFLLTACGAQERASFRDDHNGIALLLHLTDTILFNTPFPSTELSQAPPTSTLPQDQSPSTQSCASGSVPPPLSWETTWNLPCPITEDSCTLLCEILKVFFNQTLHWKKDGSYTEGELQLLNKVILLIRMLLVSVSPNHTPSCLQLLVHCSEVLVNAPECCAHTILFPAQATVMPFYSGLISSLDNGRLRCCQLDVVYEGFNVVAVLALLNLLSLKLGPPVDPKGLPSVVTAMAVLSRGNRVVRKFLKSEILPAIKKDADVSEQGTTLKSKVVGLMTAGKHGAEQVSAELLFVLCKGSADKLIRHTGYGNAAGLLLGRGLLGGGTSAEAANYSSDSEAEEEADVDLMTGGPSKPPEPSPLSQMSPEEIEQEADKLQSLFAKLQEGGVIQLLDSSGKPVQLPGGGQSEKSPLPSSSSSSSLGD